jgi:hypothetical protein
MGYELDRLLGRIGINSPTLTYSGTKKPIAPDFLSDSATAEELAKYDELVAKYNSTVPMYNRDQSLYTPYKNAYEQRLRDFNMYDAPQYNTTGPGAADLTPITTMSSPVAPTAAVPTGDSAIAFPTIEGPADTTPITVQTRVYGPDGKSYPDPSVAEAAGVFNYTFTPPMPTMVKTPTYGSQLTLPTYGAPRTVEDLYSIYLNRAPDAGGLEFWKNTFGSEISPEEVETFRKTALLENPNPYSGGLQLIPTRGVSSVGGSGGTGGGAGGGAGGGTGSGTGGGAGGSTVIPSDSPGGSDQYVDPNPAWTNMSDAEKADYYAKNPLMADITAYGAGAIKGMIPGYNLIDNLYLGLGYLSNKFGSPREGGPAPVEEMTPSLISALGMKQDGRAGRESQETRVDENGQIVAAFAPSPVSTQTTVDENGQIVSVDSGGGGTTTTTTSDGGWGDTSMGGTSSFDSAYGFARGGRVKTHYQTAGAVRLPSGYENLDDEAEALRYFSPSPDVVASPVNMVSSPMPINIEPQDAMPAVVADEPKSVLTKIAVNNVDDANAVNSMNESAGSLSNFIEPVDPVVVAVAPRAAMPGGDRMATMQAMLAAYGPRDSAYAKDLKEARARATADSDAFTKMLTSTMSSPEDSQSSKAEMYFRLAAAFGAPTKTGQFSENLGLVGKELAEYSKGKRASAREKQLLGLEVQKLKMASSKDELNTLRALSAEEMKDKRAISLELIKDYVKSGEPQSAAGKQALDEGFTKGTPEFEKRAKEIFALTVDAKTSQLQAQLAGMSLTQAKLISEQLNTQTMSDAELTKVLGTKEVIGTLEGAIGDVRQAITLNQNAYGGSLGEATEENITKIFLPKDQKLINTRLLKNFLSAQGVAKLRASFGGNPTEGERAILLSLEGIDALSSKERDAIMIRTLDALDKKLARERTTLEGLQSGSLRRYTQPQTLTPPTAGNK